MKKYNLSEIMRKAWKLRKENHISMSEALKQSWAEAKETKKEFKGYAEIESEYNHGTLYTFRTWSGHGKNRIYCNYRGKRGAGYIDLDNDCALVSDCMAYRIAMQEFLAAYKVA